MRISAPFFVLLMALRIRFSLVHCAEATPARGTLKEAPCLGRHFFLAAVLAAIEAPVTTVSALAVWTTDWSSDTDAVAPVGSAIEARTSEIAPPTQR